MNVLNENATFSAGDLSDLDSDNQLLEGGGGDNFKSNNGSTSDMSVCLESNSVLTSQVSTNHASTVTDVESSPKALESNAEKVSVAKIFVANTPAIQSSITGKVVNPSLITVMNTPITVVKTLSSTTPSHFTLVNSAVKNPTITLVNAPITVVKSIPSEALKSVTENTLQNTNNGSINNGSLAPLSEKNVHNVFVKKSADSQVPDIPQSHKILTANTFPTNNVVQNLASVLPKTVNGQKPITQGKVKILSNVMMSSGVPGPSNLLLNKANTQRFYPQPKVSNNGAPKYINKNQPNNIIKSNCSPKNYADKMPQRVLYSAHKPPYKTMPTVLPQPKSSGLKTLSPQGKGIPGQVQRTSSGLRTIPPQRPSKPANKTNYIGKHAVQAQKIRPPHMPPKIKNVKHPSPINNYHNRIPPQSSQVTFNQALTAQILETLGQDSSKTCAYESSRYDTFNFMEKQIPPEPPVIQHRPEYKPQSNLDTLSFVCQAVLLDHNYNATLPADLPPTPTISTSPQVNGVPGGSLYSPGSGKRGRTTSTCSNSVANLPPTPIIPNNGSNIPVQDDDVASDISCPSDHKMDTEGEETDTAPEAEAVANEDPGDRYGDYVTRCICGFIHDDGYMIECDKCKVWQHVRCVIKNKKVPDDYLCEICDPSKQTDRQKARAAQQQWMREIQERDARLRKEQMKEPLTDTDSSDGEIPPNNNNLSAKGRRKNESHRQVRQRRDSNKDNTVRRPLKRKERKIVKRKLKSHNKSHSDEEKVNNQSNSQLPQLRQWIDNYEEAVTNHYSPELRARISNIRINGAHSELTGQIDPSVHKCKVQNLGAGVKCLISTANLPAGVPVVELRGKYMLSTQHRTAHGGSLTTRQQRPGPFLFFYRLHRDNTEVCVDTRTYGNSARFVRRSCQPNSELRHCIEKGVLHLYIVTTSSVEKNLELTIKHESHDLAVVGSTEIPCACGNPDRCLVNKIKKNGDNLSIETGHRKRRGRRTLSVNMDSALSPVKIKEEPVPEIKQEKVEPEEEKPAPLPPAKEPIEVEVKVEAKEEVIIKEEPDVKVKLEVEEEVVVKEEPIAVKEEPPFIEEVKVEEREPSPPPQPQPVNTRRASAAQKLLLEAEDKHEKSDGAHDDEKKDKKLSREERKLQAIMKAIERMERQEQRKQEHQAKQAHRRESEPSPSTRDDDKCPSRPKRRKRKGRARTVSTNSQSGRRNRLDSADSQQATSSDETLLSPSDHVPEHGSPSKGSGLLLSSSENTKDMDAKSPERVRDVDSNSNSAHSSPETPLSSACLLVAAAVEPLEPGFKFPKTKKGLMNEWLNKGPEVVQSASQISPSSLTPHINTPSSESTFDTTSGFYTAPSKNLVALAQAATFCDSPQQPQGSAKKRWLRQAISEDQCDSPCSRPDSPPIPETVAPPKKRRLPRESISTEGTPPTTPTRVSPPLLPFRLGCDRKQDENSKGESISNDGVSKLDFRQSSSFGIDILGPIPRVKNISDTIAKEMMSLPSTLSDPRLGRDRLLFSNSEQLVGTVEKTLSFLGFEDKKPETITPTKRKLSITEYLQRKKISTCDKAEEPSVTEESNSTTSQSPKPIRNRSNSSSSNTSLASSDDEMTSLDLPEKAISAFNSEPTELERQRESVSLRVKKVLGILDDNTRNPALGVSSLLKPDLHPLSIKTLHPFQSPTFPIPGSTTEPVLRTKTPEPSPVQAPDALSPVPPLSPKRLEEKECRSPNNSKPVLFYTPDEEENVGPVMEEEKSLDKTEASSYVPPFNNPLYPNSSYTTYGSVIDDDVPYEGRNPSPPPNLSGMP